MNQVHLETLKVVQSRGVCNKNTEYYDQTESLVYANSKLIETFAKTLSIFSPPWVGNFYPNRLEFALQPYPCGAFSPAIHAFLPFI